MKRRRRDQAVLEQRLAEADVFEAGAGAGRGHPGKGPSAAGACGPTFGAAF